MAVGEPQKDVAIVGMAGRFPGAEDCPSLWRSLSAGRVAIGDLSDERWAADVYSPDRDAPGKSSSKWCGLLEEIDAFDHRLFHISPREARSMDPQQRLLLEETWRCVEAAAIPQEQLKTARTAVFVGVMAQDYLENAMDPGVVPDGYACLGTYACILANRISHFFGLTGPSLTVDAACASSLAALHMARRALLAGECDYALAAGVSLDFNPWKYISFSKARMLSPQGLCRPFDAGADGYVPGEGVAVLLLESLDQARRRGHRIDGVLKGTAVQHNGAGLSITAPRAAAQRAVIHRALAEAEVDPVSVTYVEAHGTGTSLGDPIEIAALSRVYGRAADEQPCTVGALKGNLGHLEAAAGIAGVVKVLLMLRHGLIPPAANLSQLNPLIDFERHGIRVTHSLDTWQSANGGPRRAGVSSFGFGGAIAHAVLEEAPGPAAEPQAPAEGSSRAGHMGDCGAGLGVGSCFVLAAASASSLAAMRRSWVDFLAGDAGATANCETLCHNLLMRNTTLEHRFGALATDRQELLRLLESGPAESVETGKAPIILLRGLGHPTDRQGLIHSDPLIAENFTAACERAGGATTEAVQELAFAWALGKRLLDAVPSPACLAGEGVGYWAAVALSGLLDFETAVKLALGEDEQALDPCLPRWAVLCGDRVIEPLPAANARYLHRVRADLGCDEGELQDYLRRAQILWTGQHTFRRHLEAWNDALAGVTDGGAGSLLSQREVFGPGERALVLAIVVSSLRKIDEKWELETRFSLSGEGLSELTDLLADGVLGTSAAVELMLAETPDLEGLAAGLRVDRLDRNKPYSLLRAESGLGELCDPGIHRAAAGTTWTPPAEGGRPLLDAGRLLDDPSALLELWLQGVEVRWDLLAGEGFERPELPLYVFDRKRFWQGRPLLSSSAAPSRAEIVEAHRIAGRSIVPGALLLSLVLDSERAVLEDIVFERAGREPGSLRVDIDPTGNFRVREADNELCRGRLADTDATSPVGRSRPVEQAHSPPGSPIGLEAFYDLLRSHGYDYGKTLQVVEQCREQSSSLRLKLGLGTAGEERSAAYTTLLDGVFQGGVWRLLQGEGETPDGDRLWVPFRIHRLELGVLARKIHQPSAAAPYPPASTASEARSAPQHTASMLASQKRSSSLYLQASPAPRDEVDEFSELGAGQCEVELARPLYRAGGLEASFDVTVRRGADVVLVLSDLVFRRVGRDFAVRPWLAAPLFLYAPVWQPQPLGEVPEAGASGPMPEILLAAPESRSTRVNALAGALAARGHRVEILAGDPDSWEDELRRRPREKPLTWIYFGGGDELSSKGLGPGVEELSRRTEEVILPAFLLARSLARTSRAGAAPRLLLLTQHAAAVASGESPSPPQSALLSLGCSLRHEPGLGSVQLLELDHGVEASELAEILGKELGSPSASVVAYRDGLRFERRLDPLPPALPLSEPKASTAGAWLITGGAGGLGLRVAESLAAREESVVLVGRRPPSDVDLSALEAAPGTVLYLQADVGSQQALEQALATARASFGGLRGVIHAAGVLDDHLLVQKSRDSLRRVLAPKVRGLALVDRVTRGEPLEVFAAFSSIVAIVGNRGQVDYAAANGFVDGYLAARHASGARGRSLSLGWSLWAAEGMGASATIQERFEAQGLTPLDPHAAIAALPGLLRRDVSHVAVLGAPYGPPAPRPTREPVSAPAPQGVSRPTVEKELVELFGRRAEIAEIDLRNSDSFFALGVDSLLLEEIMSELATVYDDLSPTLLFEQPNFGALADHLLTRPRKAASSPLPAGEEAVEPQPSPERPTGSPRKAGRIAEPPASELSNAVAVIAWRGVLLRPRRSMLFGAIWKPAATVLKKFPFRAGTTSSTTIPTPIGPILVIAAGVASCGMWIASTPNFLVSAREKRSSWTPSNAFFSKPCGRLWKWRATGIERPVKTDEPDCSSA